MMRFPRGDGVRPPPPPPAAVGAKITQSWPLSGGSLFAPFRFASSFSARLTKSAAAAASASVLSSRAASS